MIPFSFQKGNKTVGCEDAPPVANKDYSIVCDGLGGAGSMKHTIWENESRKMVTRTSGYLGSRIVCDCVDTYVHDNVSELAGQLHTSNMTDSISRFLSDLKCAITLALDAHITGWGIKPSSGKTLKDFPTTLASAVYIPHAEGISILAFWAGDSRVYMLTPSKGLQLLSLDDAKGAEDEMNSASEMTNCISAGNSFRLHYALYELNEPGMVFCCSDGCFDYLKSPLHFEWLLLHTILECLPDGSGAELGRLLADCIRDNMYKTIGDDTTMAGVIVEIGSSREMKDLFLARKNYSDKHAVSMNERLEELKRLQDERDAVRKKYNLSRENSLPYIHDEVCSVLYPNNTGSPLRKKLAQIPCYAEFVQKQRDIEREVCDAYEGEVKKVQDAADRLKKVCHDMLICDYMNWDRQNASSNRHPSFLNSFSGYSPVVYKQPQKEYIYAEPLMTKQVIASLIEMCKHPCFKEAAVLSGISSDELDKWTPAWESSLDRLLGLFNYADPSFKDLWIQAYFSTAGYAKERQRLGRDTNLRQTFEDVIKEPQQFLFISRLTRQKIAEYHDLENRIHALNDKFSQEKWRRLESLPEEFWADHKDEIMETMLPQLETGPLTGGGPLDKLNSFAGAKKAFDQVSARIDEVQRQVDGIWEIYRKDYQRILQTDQKGEC